MSPVSAKTPRHSLSRVSQNLLDCSVASEDAAQAVLAQRHHSKLDRLLFQGNRRRAFIDQFTNRIANFQKLVNPFSPFVTRVVTGVATFAVIELFFAYVPPRNPQLCKQCLTWLIGGAAVATDAAQQTLTQDGLQRGGNQERFHAHVDQTRDRAGRVVRVQGGEDQVPGQRRLNRNLRRLQVACFSHHYAVRVLAQERPQNARKGQADGFVHRHLHDSFQVVFDRLLRGEQFRIDGVDLTQAGVKRSCLS